MSVLYIPEVALRWDFLGSQFLNPKSRDSGFFLPKNPKFPGFGFYRAKSQNSRNVLKIFEE